MTAGQLALHLATVPGSIVKFVQSNPAQSPTNFNFPQPASRAEILKAFDESVVTVRDLLPKFDDTAMKESWHLMAGDKELFAQPRGQFVRDVMLSHWYQHRGQFSVYLRILNRRFRQAGDRARTSHRRSCAVFSRRLGSFRRLFTPHAGKLSAVCFRSPKEGLMCPVCVATTAALLAGSTAGTASRALIAKIFRRGK